MGSYIAHRRDKPVYSSVIEIKKDGKKYAKDFKITMGSAL